MSSIGVQVEQLAETQYLVRPLRSADGPESEIVSSVRVVMDDLRWRLRIYTRGTLAGELVVRAQDGSHVLLRLFDAQVIYPFWKKGKRTEAS